MYQRWEEKVQKGDETSCWQWTAATNKFGYGKLFSGNGNWVLAHRFAWEQANGEVPEGMFVLHHCDNPKCVKIDHLYLGTKQDNARDRDLRNRRVAPKGSAHGRSKLTEEQVKQIRQLHDEGKSCWSLGKIFMVNAKSVQDIVNRKNWNHI